MKNPAVYIITNKRNGTLYTGVTSHLSKRIHEHKNGKYEGFSKKYACFLLVFYEIHATIHHAIEREKQIKKLSRQMKIRLIEEMNAHWEDLYGDVIW